MTALRFSLITEREALDLPREAGTFLLCLLISAWLHLCFFISWEALFGDAPGLFRQPARPVPSAPLEIVLTLDEEERPAEALPAEEAMEAPLVEPMEAFLTAEPIEAEKPAAAEELPEIDSSLALAGLPLEEPNPARPLVLESEGPRFKSYNTTVRGSVAAKWLVPPEARINFQPGRLVVNCTIGRDGSLIRFVVDESTGNSILDHAGLEALRAAAPFPPFPPELAAFSQLDITMIFDYRARYLNRAP